MEANGVDSEKIETKTEQGVKKKSQWTARNIIVYLLVGIMPMAMGLDLEKLLSKKRYEDFDDENFRKATFFVIAFVILFIVLDHAIGFWLSFIIYFVTLVALWLSTKDIRKVV